jgi:hypothetical protein
VAKFRYRLLIALGVAVAVYGFIYLATAHGLSDHRHTNPSPGDEQSGGGLALIALGSFLTVSGLWYRSRDREA